MDAMTPPRAPVVPLGAVVARRELRTASGDPVVVLVGTPVHVGDGWDWVCPFRIEGLGEPADAQAHGIDALQALQLASTAIRGALERSGAPLRWLDSEFWEAGFPRPVEALGVRELEALLHAHLDDATARWLAQASARRGKGDGA
jgi:hypothetical protein